MRATGGNRASAGLLAEGEGQRLGSGHEHGIRNPARIDREHSQADTREDIGVVGLIDWL
jgi:hypothetical protein